MTSKTITIQLESPEATDKFGFQLGTILLPDDIVCLEGGLGSGKTTMTQAIARGLNVENGYYINSPSFNILHEYPARLSLFHMDFYRLDNSDDILDMGLDEYFFKGGVTVIEWASKAKGILPEQRLEIDLVNNGATSRSARVIPFGESWVERIDSIILR